MNELITISGVSGYIDENGTARKEQRSERRI